MHTATIATKLAPALSSYGERLHTCASGDNQLVSPLGAWMLLALCARGSDGRLRDELTKVLGMDVDLAATAVASLLEKPHPAVATGAGIWTSREVHAGLAPWLAQLPVPVDRGQIPSKPTLDKWAADRTQGLIRGFPAVVSPDVVLVLTTALATKVKWMEPFWSVRASELNGRESSEWSRRVKRVLRAPTRHGHTQFIAATERAGDVCVHTVSTHENMTVTSVMAEQGVPPADVIASAYDLAVAVTCQRPVDARSLFDLPLGDSPMWAISEEETLAATPGERQEMFDAVLPAWSSEATHDLSRAELGFPAAAMSLARLTGVEDRYGYAAKQSVVARYNRTGFEAAALTAFALCGAAGHRANERGVLRIARLRFGHPFAVVAVTQASVPWPGDVDRTKASELWYGLPVYSAWVTVPVEAEEDPDDAMLDNVDEQIDDLMPSVRSRSPVPPPHVHADEKASRTPWSRAVDWIKNL